MNSTTARHARRTPRRRRIATSAALLAAGVGIVAGIALAQPAWSAPRAHGEHRVACAATEDSRLTTCGTHRAPLDYRHGAWYAPASPAVSLSADSQIIRGGRDCKYTIHVNTSPGPDQERLTVSGWCNGHLATGVDVRRDLRELFLPPHMRILRARAHSAIVCFGDCGTSARVWEVRAPDGHWAGEASTS